MFINKFPYSDNQQLNLDWVIEQIRYLSEAAHVSFDDTIAGLGSDNVQGAIEKLKELLDYYAQQFVGVAIIDSAIPEANFTNGYTYNHMQTVNDPTLMSIVDAIRLDRYIVLKRTSGDAEGFFICSIVNYIPADYKHEVILINPVTLTVSQVNIYGINDADNIYAEIDADVNQTRVTSFASRTGDVVPADGDYEASEVVYDDTNTSLGATRVQTAIEAIKALIPLLYVASFNGRNGTVTPQASDYDADQIDYDNTVSGLTATDVQAAIDEIVNLVLSAGVASWNGRTGAVNPQAGDYDADQIDYDNSVSGLTATDVQAAIDELVGIITNVTITLTLNGAKEDTITVKDSNNQTIGTVIFASGQTSGTLTASVAPGYSDTWTFTSSVAKDTTLGTSDYVKTATITDTASQTVNVYPDNALYWYGNKLNCVTFRARTGVIYREAHAQIVEQTNSIYLDNNSDDGGRKGLMSDTTIDVSAFTTLKMLCETTLNTNNYSYTIMDESTSISVWDGNTINEILSDQTEFTKQIKSGTLSATGNKYMIAGNYASGTSYPIKTEIWALWLE